MGDLEKQERVEEGDGDGDGGREEAEKERLLGGMAVLDFDMLCSSVALQSAHGTWGKLGDEEQQVGGVLRMWEGELLDCFDDRRIAFQSACCPCYQFGKNMKRAGFGSCYVQAVVYFLLAIGAFLNFIFFTVTRRHYFLYLAVAFAITVGAYLGFFRTRMRKKFNIKLSLWPLIVAASLSNPLSPDVFRLTYTLLIVALLTGSDSSLDDCVYHFVCPCCSLCQESRTLEMNNVQDGTWHGRGDTICIGDGSKALFELSPPPVVSIKSSTEESCMENRIDVSNQS